MAWLSSIHRTETSALNSTSKTIAECFNEFFEEITPSDAERQHALSRAGEVSQEISLHLPVKGITLTGSAARSTSIREFSDIDILVDIAAQAVAEESPNDVISQLTHILNSRTLDTHISENVVRVQFEDGIYVDVLAAFNAGVDSAGLDVYKIPSSDRQRWMTYVPGVQDRRIQEKSDRLGEGFKRIIRLIKWWNVHNETPLASYDIEVLAYETFDAPMPEMPRAVASFFEAAVLESLYKCSASSTRLLNSGELAQRALNESLQGNIEHAIACWRYLLGDQFPDVAS